VFAHGLAKSRVVGHLSLLERSHVELDEPLALLLGDPQAAVHGDEVGEAQLS